MVFSSFIFLFLFLPVTTLVYFVVPAKLKNLTLLLASLIFYAWGAPTVVPILLISCAIDYGFSHFLAPVGTKEKQRKRLLIIAISINVALLGYFKYMNFFVSEMNSLLQLFNFAQLSFGSVVLPIGISFFTFQKISYLVDVYRGQVSPARSLFDYTLYVSLFPQLIAGPIVRYVDVADQIINRQTSSDLFLAGTTRFVFGLAKKVLIADAMGTVADNIFGLNLDQLTPLWAWIGAIAYAFQIYFDFSGYSDMAIGLGWIFGFKFKENFNRPYLSQNITEFWRRWHISLSRFMREYLYFPLGGSKGSNFQTYRNLWLVFLFSGLWHGAAWNFVVWGLYHGFFLIIDRVFWLRISERLPYIVNITISFIVVLFGWVLFRSESLVDALNYAGRMLSLTQPTELLKIPSAILIDNRAIFIMALAAFLSFVPYFKIEPITINFPSRAISAIFKGGIVVVLLILSCSFLAARGYTPFLYFRF